MKKFSDKKYKKGFTTMEVVLVVAILVITMAIAIPGIIRVSRNLKIAKLDDIAREIYTSAQSQTISLSVGGRLTRIEGKERTVEERSAATPAKVTYVYKSDSGSVPPTGGTDLLLPLGSIEEGVRQNYYIIEYNPVTAMINAVYYWENDGNDFPTDPQGYGVLDPTDKNARMTYGGGMIGYYGGGDVGRLSPDYNSDVTAELVNDEELYLTIMQGVSDGTPISGTITVTLTDTDTGAVKKIASFDNKEYIAGISGIDYISFNSNKTDMAGNILSPGTPNFKLTLDSFNSELRFSKLWWEGSDFHPGCNLKVTVSFQEEGKQVREESFLTNSLFASVEEYEDLLHPMPDGSRTAYISCARHLENLGVLWVYPDYPNVADTVAAALLPTEDQSGELNGVVNAVQTKDIDWHESQKTVGIDIAVHPVSFKPILNGNLKMFDGGGNKISHVDIFGDVETEILEEYTPPADGFGIGLFSRFEGDSLTKVNLENCTIQNLTRTEGGTHEPLHVGLLTGTVDGGVSIEKCHAYATVVTGDDIEKVASFCSIKTPDGTESVGGLFGLIKGTGTVKNCSASLTSIDGKAKYAGGLAGTVDCNAAVTISECYADTGVWSSTGWKSGISTENAETGGLLGNVKGSNPFTLKNSYAVGSMNGSPASSATFGLVGAVAGGANIQHIQNCYAAFETMPELLPAGITVDSTCINYSGGYSDFATLIDNGSFVAGTSGKTHAYGLLLAAAPGSELSYPFPKLSNIPHYGDWPDEMSAEALMAYYEVYKNKGETDKYSIGFYSYNKAENKEEFNTLKDDGELYMDGYAVMFPIKNGRYNGVEPAKLLEIDTTTGKPTNIVVKYNGHDVSGDSHLQLRYANGKFNLTDNIVNGLVPSTGIESNSKTYYYPLFLSSAMMAEEKNDLAKKDSYYQKLEVEVRSKPAVNVYFNPYVAKSDFVTAGTAPAAPAVSILRSPRQVTAYTTSDAMQKTAVGNRTLAEGNDLRTHTLRLERDIKLTDNITSDKSIAPANKITCQDLKIPRKDASGASKANVILELNGKTLIGTGNGSVVSAYGGQLTVYGYTAAKPDGEGFSAAGTITGGKADKGGGVYIESDVEALLKKVKITGNSAKDKSSVNITVTSSVTLDGCTIIEND